MAYKEHWKKLFSYLFIFEHWKGTQLNAKVIARAPISLLDKCRKYNHFIGYISNSKKTFVFNLPVFAGNCIWIIWPSPFNMTKKLWPSPSEGWKKLWPSPLSLFLLSANFPQQKQYFLQEDVLPPATMLDVLEKLKSSIFFTLKQRRLTIHSHSFCMCLTIFLGQFFQVKAPHDQ